MTYLEWMNWLWSHLSGAIGYLWFCAQYGACR